MWCFRCALKQAVTRKGNKAPPQTYLLTPRNPLSQQLQTQVHFFKNIAGTSLVQWLKNLPCNAGDTGLIPSQGTKIPQAKEL